MNIKRTGKTCRITDIKIGECFIFCGHIYMRIDTSKLASGNYQSAGVDLETGKVVCFVDCTCLSVEVTVTASSSVFKDTVDVDNDDIQFGKGCNKCPAHDKCEDAFQSHSHGCNHYNRTEEEFEAFVHSVAKSKVD